MCFTTVQSSRVRQRKFYFRIQKITSMKSCMFVQNGNVFVRRRVVEHNGLSINTINKAYSDDARHKQRTIRALETNCLCDMPISAAVNMMRTQHADWDRSTGPLRGDNRGLDCVEALSGASRCGRLANGVVKAVIGEHVSKKRRRFGACNTI